MAVDDCNHSHPGYYQWHSKQGILSNGTAFSLNREKTGHRPSLKCELPVILGLNLGIKYKQGCGVCFLSLRIFLLMHFSLKICRAAEGDAKGARDGTVPWQPHLCAQVSKCWGVGSLPGRTNPPTLSGHSQPHISHLQGSALRLALLDTPLARVAWIHSTLFVFIF